MLEKITARIGAEVHTRAPTAPRPGNGRHGVFALLLLALADRVAQQRQQLSAAAGRDRGADKG